MSVQTWILLITGIVVGIPAIWMVVGTIKGPPVQRPTYWCELPPSAAPGFHVVVALSAAVQDRVPTAPQDLDAVSVATTGQRVGLVLAPGTYWLYAVKARGPVGMIEAVDSVFAAIAAGGATLVPVGSSPVTVGSADARVN